MAGRADRPQSRGSTGDRLVELFPDVAGGAHDDSPDGAGPATVPVAGSLVAVTRPEPPPDQEIFIPIHKFVRLTEREVAIIDHPAFQRLGEVLQLGQTYLVYRGATHRRHEHALGTLHVAEIMIEALERNARAVRASEDEGDTWRRDEALTPAEYAFARLGALLHDIGHLPAGHTFEDELGLFAKHDSMERLELVLHRRAWLETDAPMLAQLVDEQYRALMTQTGYDVSPHELLLALIAHDYAAVRGEDRALGDTPSFRLSVCRDLIGNTICADLLDYLHRDWHHIGRHRQFDTRLIDYMELRRREAPAESRLVVYLRDRERVRNDAVSAILDLLESRYQLYEMGLYHRTKLAASAMLERAVSELAYLLGDVWLAQLPERLLDCSDAEMLGLLRADAQLAGERGSRDRRQRLAAVADLLVSLRQRRLHKKLYQRFRSQFTLAQATALQAQYASSADPVERLRPGERRLQALRQLENDFQLPPTTLTMYCPPAGMSTKVAEVQILLDGNVRSLAEHERLDDRLTGGHLAAQQRRFENLWHVYFSCEHAELERLRKVGLHALLIDAIDCFVLGLQESAVSLEERALTIAHGLAAAPESPWHARSVVSELPLANRQDDQLYYPTGLPALRALYRR